MTREKASKQYYRSIGGFSVKLLFWLLMVFFVIKRSYSFYITGESFNLVIALAFLYIAYLYHKEAVVAWAFVKWSKTLLDTVDGIEEAEESHKKKK